MKPDCLCGEGQTTHKIYVVIGEGRVEPATRKKVPIQVCPSCLAIERKYNPEVRVKPLPTRKCAYCGLEFIRRTKKVRFCCESCRVQWSKRKRERERERDVG